jgi:LysM repeat protein
MDTISRENNSMLPIGAAIVGALGLLLGLYSSVTVSKVKTQVAAQQEKVDKIDDIQATASSASSKADAAKASIDSVAKQTQDAFTAVGNSIGTIQAQLTKMEESQKRPAAAHGARGHGEPAVAGPGEYVVKPGDSGRKIARANGCTLSELEAVNPGIDWRRLKVGQKIKLPEKKS